MHAFHKLENTFFFYEQMAYNLFFNAATSAMICWNLISLIRFFNDSGYKFNNKIKTFLEMKMKTIDDKVDCMINL